MKGMRFYADLPGTLQRGSDAGLTEGRERRLLPPRSTVRDLREYAALTGALNVVALLLGKEHQNHDYTQEALVATFGFPDSDTSLGSVDHGYLRKCRRIPERLARALHPRLFSRLDKAD